MQFEDALVALVGEQLNLGAQRETALLKDPKIMDSALGVSGADNRSCCFVNDYLGFERVPLLFTGVELSLFFLGVPRGFPSHRPPAR